MVKSGALVAERERLPRLARVAKTKDAKGLGRRGYLRESRREGKWESRRERKIEW